MQLSNLVSSVPRPHLNCEKKETRQAKEERWTLHTALSPQILHARLYSTYSLHSMQSKYILSPVKEMKKKKHVQKARGIFCIVPSQYIYSKCVHYHDRELQHPLVLGRCGGTKMLDDVMCQHWHCFYIIMVQA